MQPAFLHAGSCLQFTSQPVFSSIELRSHSVFSGNIRTHGEGAHASHCSRSATIPLHTFFPSFNHSFAYSLVTFSFSPMLPSSISINLLYSFSSLITSLLTCFISLSSVISFFELIYFFHIPSSISINLFSLYHFFVGLFSYLPWFFSFLLSFVRSTHCLFYFFFVSLPSFSWMSSSSLSSTSHLFL